MIYSFCNLCTSAKIFHSNTSILLYKELLVRSKTLGSPKTPRNCNTVNMQLKRLFIPVKEILRITSLFHLFPASCFLRALEISKHWKFFEKLSFEILRMEQE